jgi:magnesium chelatase subunit H
MHAAFEWAAATRRAAALHRRHRQADIVIVTMLFMEDHFQPVLPALQRAPRALRRDGLRMSRRRGVKLTRMGKFDMDKPASGPMALLKKLRGKSRRRSRQARRRQAAPPSGGEKQMKMLRRLPQLLRFIPGTAQDVRAYFLTLQYWLGGSEDNVRQPGALPGRPLRRRRPAPRAARTLRGPPQAPVEYPEVGVYHPRLPGRMAESAASCRAVTARARARVGLLLLRSYLLAGNAGHYDGVIAALEARACRWCRPLRPASTRARPSSASS